MLARANEIKNKNDKKNVRFVESQITDISAIPSNTADCIISNCVINLVPESEKHLVFKEIYRLLKPGGRVALSDILAKKPLPEKLRANMALYVGCVSGASLVEQYETYLKEAGFPADSIAINNDGADLNVYLETNEDGTRTVGGTGGNLCCNPRIESTPAATVPLSCCSLNKTETTSAPTASCSLGSKRTESVTPAKSCCSTKEPESLAKPDAATASSCVLVNKAEPDTAVSAAAASSSSCCGGEKPADQTYAFDEKDLADLEGEDLNSWAGKFA